MGLFDFLKAKEPVDPGLFQQLRELGFTQTEEEDGSLTVTCPDGRVCMMNCVKRIITVKYRQLQPNKILFSFTDSGHFVNDPNPEGYRQLIDGLKKSKTHPRLQATVYAFLLERYRPGGKAE